MPVPCCRATAPQRAAARPRRRVFWLPLPFVAALACSAPAPGELEGVVLAALDAHQRRDSAAVQALLSPEGRSLAQGSCSQGLAIHCLGYPAGAQLISREARLLGSRLLVGLDSEDGGPLVELKTVWSPSGEPGRRTLCQQFELRYDGGAKRWGIASFRTPRACD
jgi:hypothetical protein